MINTEEYDSIFLNYYRPVMRYDKINKTFIATDGTPLSAKNIGTAFDELKKGITWDEEKDGYIHQPTRTWLAHTIEGALEKKQSLEKIIALRKRMRPQNFEHLQKSILEFEKKFG